MSKKRKIVFIIFFIILLGVFYALGRQIYNSLRSEDRLNNETEALIKLQARNSELKNKLNEVQSVEFIEKEARNKLNLLRAEETIILISQKEIDKILGQDIKVEEVKIPNWQGWLRLFFK